MKDFEDSKYDTDDKGPRRLLTRTVAILLVFVMTCGIVTTPIAFYLSEVRDDSPQPTVAPVLAVKIESDSPSEEVNRIAFITLDGQLATTAADGSDQRQLTESSQRYEFPAWSPDGSSIAVIGGNDLLVLPDVDGALNSGLVKPLYSSGTRSPFYIYWSPQGDHVSFLANHTDGIGLHLSNIENGDNRLLATGQPFYWDWAPDSDLLLIHSGGSRRGGTLAFLSTSGSEPGDNIAEPGLFQSPGISPSGRLLAYAEMVEDGLSKVVVQDQNDKRLLVEPHQGQVYMNWSPTEDILAYSNPSIQSPNRYGPLRLFDSEIGTSKTIVNNQVVAFFWAPDGRSIAYLTLLNPDPGDVQANSDNIYRTDLQLQPQHPEILFDLWVIDLDSTEPRWLTTFETTPIFITQFLPYFDQYGLSHELWSPDSRFITLPIVQDGEPFITSVSMKHGTFTRLAEGLIGFWSPN